MIGRLPNVLTDFAKTRACAPRHPPRRDARTRRGAGLGGGGVARVRAAAGTRGIIALAA